MPPRIRSSTPHDPRFLGIEAGGTRTSACWMDLAGRVTESKAFGPANLKLLSESQLLEHLHAIAAAYSAPAAVGIGMAGARTDRDQARLRSAARQVWPGIPCIATHDLDSALAAIDSPGDAPRVLILSGTGSCCYGRDPSAQPVRIGGWGHLLGDQGSGYAIALEALRQSLQEWDQSSRWSPLGRALLEYLHANEPDELIGWIHSANKNAVAALAPLVFRAAAQGDRIARRTLRNAALQLATSALACARRVAPPRKHVLFILAGGVLRHQPAFARLLQREILEHRPNSQFVPLRESGAVGSARLARRAWETASNKTRPSSTAKRPAPPAPPLIPSTSRLSPTEERHPKSMALDRLPIRDAIDLMLDEDALIPAAIRHERRHLEHALRLIHRALASGGRLFYVGAGTSGRLGVLDASECPPTFRTDPEWIQGIIAGGADAVFRAVEGAEDDASAGGRALAFRDLKDRDIVVGIAASGRTPFVWGALAEARRRKASTVLICFNPHLVFAPQQRPNVVIAPRIGPEILTGSTRLKSGTATKLILNILTTLTMVRLGKVISNLMVDLNPANAKLRERAIRITRELTGSDDATARARLEAHHWIVQDAVKSLRSVPASRCSCPSKPADPVSPSPAGRRGNPKQPAARLNRARTRST